MGKVKSKAGRQGCSELDSERVVVPPGAIPSKGLERLGPVPWSKRVSSLDVLAIVSYLEYYHRMGPVSLYQIQKQVTEMVQVRLPNSPFSIDEMEERMRQVLWELVRQGFLGFSLIEPENRFS